MPEQPCKCGRSWPHCLNCGSANLYLLKLRSKYTGEQWFSCRRCQNEFKIGDECTAEQEIHKVDAKIGKPKEKDNRPQFILEKGSVEYWQAYADRYNELADKGGKGLQTEFEVRSAMSKEGWEQPPESPSADSVSSSDTKATTSEPVFTPMALEEIIQRMKEQK